MLAIVPSFINPVDATMSSRGTENMVLLPIIIGSLKYNVLLYVLRRLRRRGRYLVYSADRPVPEN